MQGMCESMEPISQMRGAAFRPAERVGLALGARHHRYIYIPFKRISLGTAGKFSPYAGHVWKHGTYLEDVGGCISTEGLALGARRHSQRTSRFADGFGGGGGGRGEREC